MELLLRIAFFIAAVSIIVGIVTLILMGLLFYVAVFLIIVGIILGVGTFIWLVLYVFGGLPR